MRPIFLIFFALAMQSARAQQRSSVDVLHYAFSIELSDKNDSIICSASIRLNDSSTGHTVTLDLASVGKNGRGMKVKQVLNNEDGSQLKYSHVADHLKITVPAHTGAVELTVDYSGIPADGMIISKNRFGQRTFFSDNWPNRGHHWLVCDDRPSDKASVEFIVTAPSHYQVISNGLLVEETNIDAGRTLTHWREEKPLPVKVMAVGAAEFAVTYVGDIASVPLYSWVFAPDRDKGFADYAKAADILPFLTAHIGDFPFAKLANVQSKTIFGGMENASAIFLAENSVTGTRKTEKLIAHEIVHQWFGDMATEADWRDLWLSEGFATYLSMLYMENRYGADTLVADLRKSRTKVINFYKERQTPVVDTSQNYMELLNPNCYDKAGWVLHMLHRQLGDSLFWKGIKTYYARYAGRNATTNDFEKVIEEVAGRDETQFFHQWLYTAGQPVLHLTRSYVNKTLSVTITQLQPTLFHFPLTVAIHSPSGDVTRGIRIEGQTTTISVPLETAPTDVVLDPQTSLLFELR